MSTPLPIPIEVSAAPPPARPAERRPQDAELRLVRSALGEHLFVVDGSRLFDVDAATADAIRECLEACGPAPAWLRELGLERPESERYVGAAPAEPPAVRALSLNVAQACNMACRYCYADEGRFNGAARRMSPSVARAAVDRLLAEAEPDARVVVGFMGGEPLLARGLVHEVARYAWRRARESQRHLRFSITTNATLIEDADARLFAELPFAVTVSVDGDAERHRRARPMKNGGDSYAALRAGLERIERAGRPRRLAARATVTAHAGPLLPVLDHLIDLGFDDVGFSPVVQSPAPELALDRSGFDVFLAAMIACGEKALGEIRAGRPYPFGNLEAALEEIHRGTHRPYPCGAGAGYLSVSAEGRLFACHRLVDDERFAMGDVHQGPDASARRRHLADGHVDRQQPCRDCWARYLCGGGCYHEVRARGRLGCDYIRGWLDFCLRAYAELSASQPWRPTREHP